MGKIVKAVVAIAAVAAIAYFAPQLAPALLSSLGVTATAAAVSAATAVITAVGTLAVGYAMTALAGRPRAAGSQPINFRQSIANSFIIIGTRRQGGLMIFFHPKKVGKDHYRYFVFASAGHRCKGVLRWWLNDEAVSVDPVTGLVTSGKYANAAWLWAQRGTDDETAHPVFVAECDGKWTDEHCGKGVAALYAKFKMTKDVVEAGMPTVSAEWQGADEIVDPRTGDEGWTDLATPAIYWWLRLPREEGGFGAPPEEIPDDSLLAAWTNICDEDVPTLDGTEKRYTIDALIETGAAPSEIRETFVTCTAGTYAYVEGEHRLRPGYWNPPSVILEESDLAGPIGLPMLLEGDEVATEIQGAFVDPALNYQPQPVPTRSVASSDVRQISVDLPHITSHTRGQRILEIMLRRSQCEKRPTWPMNIAGLAVSAMDTVQTDTARHGLSNYAFVVDQWQISADFSVNLGLREENEDIYAEPVLKPKSVGPELAVAEPVTDDPEVTDFTVTDPDAGSATLRWRNPQQAGWASIRIMRSTTSTLADAVAIGSPIVGGLGEVMEVEDEGLAADDYWWWWQTVDDDGTVLATSGPVTAAVTTL